MSGLLSIISRRAARVLRAQSNSLRANLYTRPAKDKVGAVESTIGITMFALALLGPAGWILAHLEEYKKKE